MSLPRYIVNFDEIANLLNEITNKPNDGLQKQYSKGKQKSKGMRLRTEGDKLTISDRWKTPSEIWVTGIKIGVSDEKAWRRDKISLIINNEVVFEDLYLKKVSEYKNFRVFRPMSEGQIIEVVLHGNSEDVEIWLDIDYIGDLSEGALFPRAKVIVRYLNQNSLTPIKEQRVYLNQIGILNFSGDEIEGWELLDPKNKTIEIVDNGDYVVDFLYKETLSPEIKHLYDWKFILRWEGNVRTDLDFYAEFGDKKVYYGHKSELILDDNGEPIQGVWLDRDYMSHSGSNDRELKPEIMTILGEPATSVRFFVRNYGRGNQLSEEVTVEAFRVKNDGTEELIAKVSKGGSLFHQDKIEIDFMTVYPATGEIIEH